MIFSRNNTHPTSTITMSFTMSVTIKLNAVLMRAAALDRDQLAERLKSVRSSRRELGYYGQEAAGAGGRCDLSA